jgi:putative ABC transport system permease protein
MDALISDLGFALRSLRKAKLFTLVSLASLALGIGACVTIFSIVDAIALRPLPYLEPDRLVDLHESSATKLCAGCGVGTSYAGFTDWREEARSFSRMGAYLERPFAISGAEAAERVSGALVSADVFPLLGTGAALGRGFTADDDRIGAPAVVLLSDALWNRRYAADRRVIGQTIRVNGVAHTVIGVMPPRFKFPEFAELWVPAAPNAAGAARDQRDFDVIARLKPGVSLKTADAEMRVLAKNLEARYPEQREWSAGATSYRSATRELPVSLYAALLGAVGFVLLIVCANIAGLLLARGIDRRREIAIRAALGASRARIVRHLLAESLVLSLAGGALGLLVALWGVDLAVWAIGATPPFYVEFGVNVASVLFCAATSIAAGVLFGLLPALRSASIDVQTALKDGGNTIRKSALRGALVVGELALSMVLLAGAGLMMKSFVRVSAPEQGYDDRHLITGTLEFNDVKYRERPRLLAAQRQLAQELDRLPGSTSAALDRIDFLAGFGRGDRSIRAEGMSSMPTGASPRFFHVVSPSYFATIKLPLVAGRVFTDADRDGAERVVIINKRMAEMLWPSAPALGKHIKLGEADTLPWLTVVGISGDIRGGDRAGSQRRNYAYVPMAQTPGDRATILVRPTDTQARVTDALRAAVRTIDPDLPVVGVQTTEARQRDDYWVYELFALAMGCFAGFAVLLAAVGLYGVIAYMAAQRTREIGVRIALGAEPRHVIALIAGQGGRLVALGIVAGAAGSALLLRVLDAMLFGASPIDLPIYATVAMFLSLVAMAAVWHPARRASRIDPLAALRAE